MPDHEAVSRFVAVASGGPRGWVRATTQDKRKPAALFGSRHRYGPDAGLGVRTSAAAERRIFELRTCDDGLDLPAPEHRTLSRRARTWSPPVRRSNRQPLPYGPLYILVDSTGLKIYDAGRWLEEKHVAKSHFSWRKLNLSLDAGSGEIIAHRLTDQDTSDGS